MLTLRPIISVIIPCFGVEKYLPDIFEDLINQTFEQFELIFINDGGGEKISQLIQEFAKKDKRVVAVEKENGGVSSARNIGIELAKGEWICFVDPDDRVDNNYLKSLYMSVTGTKSQMGIGGFTQLFTKKNLKNRFEIKQECKEKPTKDVYKFFPPFNVPWNKIYKTDLLKKNAITFPIGVTYLEDELFNLQVYNSITYCSLVKDCGYTYMMNDSNSALSKYHKDLKQNMLKSGKLKKELMIKFGISKNDIHKKEVESIATDIYILVINLFKIGSKLTFKECCQYIKNEIIGDKIMMSLYKEHDRKSDKLLVKICNVLIDTKSPFLITLVFKMMFQLKYKLKLSF